jgi:predicted dehydrogenase
MKTSSLNRRQFIQRTAVVTAAVAFPFVSSRNVLGANNRLNLAGIGAGGKGEVDVNFCSSENIVALCDVDENRAAATFERFAKAKRYTDFRQLLEKEANHIDAVTVSTPDHIHAHAAILAMKHKKHVYCQKPLTHTIHEARLMREVARQTGVVTQMGNQGHSQPDSRRLVELIRGGVLGDVKEIHVWTDRPIWPQGQDRPAQADQVPPGLNWDLWLGPAPERPYNHAYVPFKWRGWWDFGTGALGDMGCHNMDLAYFALNLRDPVSVEAQSSEVKPESAPVWSVITYNFRSPSGQPLPLTWYDGGKKPAPELAKQKELPSNGCIMIGTKDTLYVPSYWGPGSFVSGAKTADFSSIPQTLPRRSDAAKDNDLAHHQEWVAACKGEGKALSNFDYAGPMTEAVLLGNVALRAGTKVEWDAKALKVTNHPDANRYVKSTYRKGWELPV